MLLGLDLDGPVRDKILAVITATHQKYGVRLTRDMFNEWDPKLGARVGVDEEAYANWAWNDPMIDALATPTLGVARTLRMIIQHHEIIIITANPNRNMTQPWLDYWGIPYTRVIHTTDKLSAEFDALIDDSLKTIREVRQADRTGILWDLPWNRTCESITFPTIRTWQDYRLRSRICANT